MLQYSPKIVTDGLVMCLDASNNKSYPTTDLPVKNGLNLWLDASDDTTFSYSSGTIVSQWRDKSGLNNHAIVGGGSPVRSVAINSRKAVSFTSTSWFRCLTGSFNSTATHFLVCRATTSSATYQRVYNGGADAYIFMGGLSNNIATFWGTGSSWIDVAANSPSTTILNTLRIISVINNGSTGTPYYDGTAMSTKTTTNSGAYVGYELNSYSGGNTAQALIGEVCEIIVFNKQLSTTELKQVHTYLGQKWGISNTDRSIIDLVGNDDNGLLGNGTVANMPVYDVYNRGFKFDGSNDYISVGTNATLQTNTVSIGAFFKTINNGQAVQFIGGYGDTGNYGYWIGTAGTDLRFKVGNGTTSLQITSGIVPNNDQIYYVVGTYDGASQKIYVDGVLKATGTTVTGNMSYTGMTDGFLLGQVQSFTAGRYMTGSIYAMQVYNRALTATEVAQNYEAMKSRFANTIIQNGLVLNLDASNPYSYAGSGATWYDVSAGGYNATIVNAPTFTSDSIKYFTCSSSQNFTISNPISAQPKLSQIWTVSAWVNIDTTTGAGARYLISGLNNGLAVEWFDSGTLLYLNAGVDDYYTYGNSIEGSGWVMLTFLFRNSDGYRKIYSNITDITTSGPNLTSIPAGNSGTFTIANNMRGKIAQIMMYDRLLTAAEITQNYNATKDRFGL